MEFQEFIGAKPVDESLTGGKAGETKLKKSSITDARIQNCIKVYAESKGISKNDAEAQFKKELDVTIDSMGTGILNKNMAENAAERVAFDLISSLDPDDMDLEQFGIDDSSDLLDTGYFYDLTQFVLGENREFFPLKNPFTTKAVRPFFFITPTHLPLMKDHALKNSAQHHCKTAFCTPNAEMVFNKKFTEGLSLTALVMGIKPKSRKYVSNGGKIPDHYCYLEFVMVHELLHFSAGDHFYTKQMVKLLQKKYPKIGNRAHKILNFVGDYINNWQLVKSGYEQLPIGLFSEDINYEKIGSYEEIIDVVVQEVLKEDEKMSREREEQMDDHMDNEDDTPSQGGADSDPGDDPNDPGSDDGGQGSSGGNDEESENGSGEGSGSGQSKERKIFKVGDIVTINSTGKRAKVVYASKPNADGLQDVKVEEIELSESELLGIMILEAITLTNDDITMWNGQGDDNGNDSNDSSDSNGEGDSDDSGSDSDSDGQSGSSSEPVDDQDNSSGDSNSTKPSSDASDGQSGDSPSNGSSQAGEEKHTDMDDTTMEDALQKRQQAIDDALRKNQDAMNKRDDGNNDASSALDKKDDTLTTNQIKQGMGAGNTSVNLSDTTPTIPWRKVMKKMIPKGSFETEDSYQRMSRNAAGSLIMAQELGAGAIQPGEVQIDDDKKGLVFVIDNSGSVYSVLKHFNNEILNLLKTNKKMLSNMYIIKFSGTFEAFKVNVKEETYQQIEKESIKKTGNNIKFDLSDDVGDLKELFKRTIALDTKYTPAMHEMLKAFHKHKMNIVMFTDHDLVYDNNFEKFFRMIDSRSHSGALFITNKHSYDIMEQKYGYHNWMTILK